MGIDAQMLVRTMRTDITDEMVRREAGRIVNAFPGTMFVMRPEPGSKHRPMRTGRHALELIKQYDQDGPRIRPKKGETLIEVHLWTRYYGVDYERGDLTSILDIARWRRTVFAPCEVWYGGDSSGVVAELLDEAAERELWDHFVSPNGRAYFAHNFGMQPQGKTFTCEFCAIPAVICGGGGAGRDQVTFFRCNGCAGSWTMDASGKVSERVDVPGGEASAYVVQQHDHLDTLFDLIVSMENDQAEITSITRDPGRNGDRLVINANSKWHEMAPADRHQLYERVGLALMNRSSRVGREQQKMLDGGNAR